MSDENLIVTRAPHSVARLGTGIIMRDVLIALLPELIAAGVYLGRGAVLRVLFSVFCAESFEWLTRRVLKRKQTVKDLSAAVTGMIFAFLLPPDVPYNIILLGDFIAIVIVKQLFGGLGQNFVNPAAFAWAAVLLSFPGEVPVEGTPIELYTNAMPLPGALTMFTGPLQGAVGAVSTLAILVGGLYLVLRKIIEPVMPICYILSVLLISFFWGLDPIFHVLAGGVFFGAFFLATDPVTTPALTGGKVLFAVGCGFFTMVMRIFCTFPDSMPFAVILMNLVTPHIDRFMRYLLYKRNEAYEKQ